MTLTEQIQAHLTFIYGPATAAAIFPKLQARLETFRQQHPHLAVPVDPNRRLTAADAILITYGDQVQEPGSPTLRSLGEFLQTHLIFLICVQILPFEFKSGFYPNFFFHFSQCAFFCCLT